MNSDSTAVHLLVDAPGQIKIPVFFSHGPHTPEARWRRGRAPAGVQCLPRSARPHPGYRHGERIDEGDEGSVEVEVGDDDDEDDPSE